MKQGFDSESNAEFIGSLRYVKLICAEVQSKKMKEIVKQLTFEPLNRERLTKKVNVPKVNKCQP